MVSPVDDFGQARYVDAVYPRTLPRLSGSAEVGLQSKPRLNRLRIRRANQIGFPQVRRPCEAGGDVPLVGQQPDIVVTANKAADDGEATRSLRIGPVALSENRLKWTSTLPHCKPFGDFITATG
ncbi:MAG: hypothetical protein ACQESR_11995 [Planctomycetota bacterium]